MLTKKQLCRPLVIVPALIVVYFIVVPNDLKVLIGPLVEVLTLAVTALSKVLALSGFVSPWLYMLASVVILSKTATSIWGRKSQA